MSTKLPEKSPILKIPQNKSVRIRQTDQKFSHSFCYCPYANTHTDIEHAKICENVCWYFGLCCV